MSILNIFKRQLSGVIEWKNQSAEVLYFKFPSDNDEIKNASKLIVAPGQGALLVYEGKIQDVLINEGIYELETDNHPFFTTLTKLRTGFESEHKVKIYFFRAAENLNQSWGSPSSIKYVDPLYQFPVALGANGNFSFKISEPSDVFTQSVGSKDLYTVAEAKSLLQSRIPQIMAAHLATAGISYQQIDAQLATLSAALRQLLAPEFLQLGYTLTDFKLNGTLFDPDTQARIKKIADITADALAAGQGGLSYVEMEKLKALRDAAKNEGGLAGAGLQLGAGMELGKTFADQKEAITQDEKDPVLQLKKLKLLLDEGILTQEEFDAKKKEWLGKL